MKRKRKGLTEEAFIEILDLYSKGVNKQDISSLTGVNQTTISHSLRYYGFGTKHRGLGFASMSIIDKVRESRNSVKIINKEESIKKIDFYECKILFGLIKLKFKPVKQAGELLLKQSEYDTN